MKLSLSPCLRVMPNLRLFIPALCSCFTTEILEGFDVQRTSGLGDTLRKYGHLTQAIYQYYKSDFFEDNNKCSAICPPYDEFVRRCQDLEKMTVSDVFAIQLMQVPTISKLILNRYLVILEFVDLEYPFNLHHIYTTTIVCFKCHYIMLFVLKPMFCIKSCNFLINWMSN